MKNFVDRMYIFVGMGLFSWGELMCSAPRVAQKEIQKAAYPAKKEIFIAGPPKEHFEGMSPDGIAPYSKNYAMEQVKNSLLELYAKTISLPTLAKHQKKAEGRLQACASKDNVVGSIATGFFIGSTFYFFRVCIHNMQ